jgi:hypothetical protein
MRLRYENEASGKLRRVQGINRHFKKYKETNTDKCRRRTLNQQIKTSTRAVDITRNFLEMLSSKKCLMKQKRKNIKCTRKN